MSELTVVLKSGTSITVESLYSSHLWVRHSGLYTQVAVIEKNLHKAVSSILVAMTIMHLSKFCPTYPHTGHIEKIG